GDRLLFDSSTDIKMINGNEKSDRLLRAFNGKKTTILNNQVANIHDRRVEDGASRLCRPHRFISGTRGRMEVPFWLWLKGEEELRTHALLAPPFREDIAKTVVSALETIDGLRCIKLVRETHPRIEPNEVTTKHYIWLAIDRNYIPV